MIYETLATAIVATDQVLKDRAEKNPKIEKVHNDGLPFGFLRERPLWVRIIPLVAAGGILGVWIKTLKSRKNHLLKLGLSLVLGGAVSNLADRFTRGYVVDHFHTGKGRKNTVYYNLADLCVWAGSGVFLLWTILSRRK